jgi:hypothetical protein
MIRTQMRRSCPKRTLVQQLSLPEPFVQSPSPQLAWQPERTMLALAR